MVDQPYTDYSSMTFDNFDDNLRLYADPEYSHRLAFLFSSPDCVDIRQLPHLGKGDIESDLKIAVECLAQNGMEPIAFDHTTPDIAELGFRVGRILVPELVQLGTPAYPFLGSRRLYELPNRLGLRDRVLTPADLNPDYHPYP
jgi:ribosomal protein S12 methylthiotransferase accessory factor